MNNTVVEEEVCANCGKDGVNLKACTACKLVKYCNRKCQIAHRPQHKRECRKRAAEIYDEELFQQPPPNDDCPICSLRLPTLITGCKYKICCGKRICSGCTYAPVYDDQGNIIAEKKCPFCRTLEAATNGERIERRMKRMELNDAHAIFNVGCNYRDGKSGYQKDYTKAFELFHRAAELGHTVAYNNIGCFYECGYGVEVDNKKAVHYYELSAMGGNVSARYNLGVNEEKAGNFDRALKHFMIAVRSGDDGSLKEIQKLYSYGHATKEDYMVALRSYQTYLDEIKSTKRDEAAAANKKYCYY